MVQVGGKPVTFNKRLNIISLIQMKKIAIVCFFLIITFQATQFRLNTNQVSKLNVGDSLISTLGYFKATLQQNGCTLAISTFKGPSYVNVGNYTSQTVAGNCKYLQIIDGAVVTQSNTTYMYVGSGYNLSTILTIDDWGVIRLIGTYQLLDLVHQTSQEFSVTNFTHNQTYVYPSSHLSVNFANQFGPITNIRNWMFSVSYGELSIAQIDDNGISISYSFASFSINNSQIVDFNGNTFPAAIFPNITYKPRCVQPRLYLNFKPPFVFVADPYWPVFTLYQQGRYKVLEINLNNVLDYQAWQDKRRLQSRNQPNVCPPYTFEYQGNCVTVCPTPYYYEMRGVYGYCVLTCEQYTPKNDTSRICSCYSNYQSQAINLISPSSCPNNSIIYPYGCYCNQTGKFFDRLLTLSCVRNCPETTFASNGLCMQCPKDCQTCQIDNIFRSYLQCKVCNSGFTLTNGKCYSSCSPGLGLSLVGGTCQACNDTNCLNCSQNVNICTNCSMLYTLSGGICVLSCPDSTNIASNEYFSSFCIFLDNSCAEVFGITYKENSDLKCISCNNANYFMHLNKCIATCPAGYVSNSANSCFCANSSLLTIYDKCLPIPTCPIMMGWDPSSNSCFSCKLGCLTCYNSACTSCNPGYFLYISPQGIRCRRQSPLFPCDQQYGWSQQTCLPLNYLDSNLKLILCYSTVPNCKACVFDRDDICILCNPGYFNHNNTCIKSCPNGTQPYKNLVCILLEIQTCKNPYLSIKGEEFVVNYEKVVASNSYFNYTFNGKEPQNDPVGNIPVYQQMIDRKNDGTFRITNFFHPQWICLFCNDGFGMSSDFKHCLPCTSNCLTCYMAQNNSCIIPKADPGPAPPTPTPVPTGCQYYIDQATNQCVQSCSSSTSLPKIINGLAYCTKTDSSNAQNYARIDSAIYINPDGTKHVFFVMDQSVKTSSSINLNVRKEGSVPRLADSTNGSLPNSQTAPLQSGSYVTLYDPTPSNNLYVLNLTGQITNLVTDNNLVFPNTVYGAASAQSHPEFIKTWLAYIGYIMGLTLILLHVVFIGNDLLYKVDNAIILGQTIYFFSFVQLLVGKLLAQFYYGWIFTHLGFFPNFFTNTIPTNYVQLNAPNSYKLATLDANVVRNAGFAFSLLIVFVGAYGFIAIFCWIASNLLKKQDAWHPKIAVNALIGGLEFISMSIFYWSCANLMYITGANAFNQDFYHTSRSVSIFFIVIISVYTVARWIFHPIGGLYMAKRILLAVILAASYQNNVMLAPLIILETVFTVFRYFMEVPERNRQKYYLALEYLIYVGIYLLLWFCFDAGVNTIIISIFMFVIIVTLAHDLTGVYLESRNEWEVEDDEDASSEGMAKAEADVDEPRRSNLTDKAY